MSFFTVLSYKRCIFVNRNDELTLNISRQMRTCLFFVIILFGLDRSVAFAQGVTQYVNPFMGTTTLWTPEELGFQPKPGERQWGAETFPGAALPTAMVQLTPVTMYRSGSGYQYEDSLIYGFSHTHLSGTGCDDWCDILVVPGGRASRFSHKREKASPGFYEVWLEDTRELASLAAGRRCALHE